MSFPSPTWGSSEIRKTAACRPDLDKLRNKFVFALTRTSDRSAATLNATAAAEGYPREGNMAFVAGCGLSGKCSGADSTAYDNILDMIFEPFLTAPSLLCTPPVPCTGIS